MGLLLALPGCGGKPTTRGGVRGVVTLQGTPLDQGTITFYPTNGTQRASGGALITGGKYELPAEQGLEAGSYRVEISSPKPSTTSQEDYAAGKMSLTSSDRIPEAYNTASKVTVEVKAGQTNQCDVAIP
ncbi:MAG TPA: hypothetical protein VL096_21575 [Pirellulaceae bacterium]|nr:hypothetical protein [Pirellulaceae bacterium]